MFCYILFFKECPYRKQPWTIQIIFLSPGKIVDLFSVQHNNIMSPSVVKIGKNLLAAHLKLEVPLVYGSSLIMQLTMYARVTYPLCPSISESGLREPKQIMLLEILLLLWVIDNFFSLNNDHNVFYQHSLNLLSCN